MESKAGPAANPSVQSSHSSVTSPAGGSSDNAANAATCNTSRRPSEPMGRRAEGKDGKTDVLP